MVQDEEQLPRWALRFLNLICPEHLVEEIEGDLVQKYQFDVRQYGKSRARRKLISNILRFFRPGILLRNKLPRNQHSFFMIRNYILTTLRVSNRQRLYTFINILGLSVGLAASLLIGVYIADELSYDHHIADADRIYRVGINETFKGDEILYSDTGAPLAEAMQRELPEIQDAVRLTNQTIPVQVGERAFIERKVYAADSNFFRFFGVPLIEGNPELALRGPNKVVLSRSVAKKYFDYDRNSGESPLGKQMIMYRDKKVLEVTGIYDDIQASSHMKYDIVVSSETLSFSKSDCWGCYGFKTYFKTTPNADIAVVEQKLKQFADELIIPSIEKDLNITHEQFEKSGDIVAFFIQPMLSIHLESNIDDELEPNGDIRYVYILGVSGLFLIIIACINFMNLATARAMSRSKEVGVRKTMGATGRGLIPQFILESVVYAVVSGILALVLTYIAIGPFSTVSGKELHLDLFASPYLLPSIAGLLLLVGFLAGIYPSLYLSSFNPAKVLKGGNSSGSSKSIFRNTLVIIQFTISMVLIIGTLIIFKQLNFIQNHNLGFNKENVIRIRQAFLLGSSFQAFKEELLTHSEFVSAGFASQLPPEISSTGFIKAEGSDQLVSTFFFASDYDFMKTMGGEMVEGRYFSQDFLSDSSAVVINESAARLLGYKFSEGRKVGFGGTDTYQVVGIMKDFNFLSLKSDVQPLLVFLNDQAKGTLAVRLAPGDPAEKLQLLQKIWLKYANGQALEYTFLDDDFDSQFRAEQRLGLVFAIFTGLAIFIACLGLFGLITYIAGQRMKEIGIRKVLGASASQVTYLLLYDLIKLVLISFMISIPVAWYGMEKWLESFPYRTAFDVFSVLVAGGAGLLIAVLTVGYRSLRAASTNPVDVLKNE